MILLKLIDPLALVGWTGSCVIDLTRAAQATMKVKAQKVIYRIKHAALVQCFEIWADNAKEQVMYTDGYRSGPSW